MIELLTIWLGLAVLIVSTIIFARMVSENRRYNDFMIFLFIVIESIFATVFFIYLCTLPFWFGAKEKAKLINKRYNTNYTTKQLFFAGDTVEKFLKTDKNLIDNNNRHNINME